MGRTCPTRSASRRVPRRRRRSRAPGRAPPRNKSAVARGASPATSMALWAARGPTRRRRRRAVRSGGGGARPAPLRTGTCSEGRRVRRAPHVDPRAFPTSIRGDEVSIYLLWGDGGSIDLSTVGGPRRRLIGQYGGVAGGTECGGRGESAPATARPSPAGARSGSGRRKFVGLQPRFAPQPYGGQICDPGSGSIWVLETAQQSGVVTPPAPRP